MRNEWSGPIWPTKHEPMWCQPGGGCPTCARNRMADHIQRTRGIAEAGVLARRRARWLAWCRAMGACGGGVRFAEQRATPEQAVRDAAASDLDGEQLHVMWVARKCSWRWDSRLHDARWQDLLAKWDRKPSPRAFEAVTESLLASPEWAALPWQREAGR